MDVVILTERGAELYMALVNAPQGEGWLDAVQLAAATGKNLLSPHDRHLLEDMADKGYIERREVKKERLGRPTKQFRVL